MGGWCVRDIIVMMCGAPTEPPAGFAMAASDLLVLAPRPAGSKSACNRLSVPEMVWIAVRAALRRKFRYVVPFSGTGRPVGRWRPASLFVNSRFITVPLSVFNVPEVPRAFVLGADHFPIALDTVKGLLSGRYLFRGQPCLRRF